MFGFITRHRYAIAGVLVILAVFCGSMGAEAFAVPNEWHAGMWFGGCIGLLLNAVVLLTIKTK